MIKISIYTLLIILLTGCASFKGADSTVDSITGEIISGDEDRSAKDIYYAAKGALARKQYELAIEEYRKIEANFPFSEYAEQSHLELAFADYKMNHYDVALAIVDRFIAIHSTSNLLPYAYYLRGLINFNRGKTFLNKVLPHVQIDKDPVNTRTAYDDFNYVYTNYKDSIYAEDSLKRMNYLRNTLASYELHVANYYYKRKAYIAVINRCNYLIEHYPNAPANIDALLFMQKSYEALLMKDNARDIEKIILTNYPDYESVYFQEVLDNKVRRNILALSDTADDIAIWMGFDIDDQPIDDFTGVYKVEYFTNEDLIEIPMRIKPEKYKIVHKKFKSDEEHKNEEVKDNEKKSSIFNIFSSDDNSEVFAEDFIAKKNVLDESTAVSPKINNNEENKMDEAKTNESELEYIDSEKEIIELIN